MPIASVLGYGAVSALGGSWPETWVGLLEGTPRLAGARTLDPCLDLDIPIAAVRQNRELVPDQGLAGGPALRMALSAAREALDALPSGARCRLYGGSNHGESDILIALARAASVESKERADCSLWRSLIHDPIPELIQREFGDRLMSPHATWLYSSCTSGLHALLLAASELQLEATTESTSMVVAVDALSLTGIAGFAAAGAAAGKSCRPFHIDRDGMIVGEGAAALLLGPPSAGRPGGEPRLLGMGMRCDAGHATRPDPNGAGLYAAMVEALEQAGLKPSDIGALVLHGTGTAANDAAEAQACRALFGQLTPPATSVKASLGHTMGASGLFNCLTAIASSRSGLLPPTGLEAGPVMEGVDLVLGEPRPIPVGSIVMTNGIAFGGNNVSLVFEAR